VWFTSIQAHGKRLATESGKYLNPTLPRKGSKLWYSFLCRASVALSLYTSGAAIRAGPQLLQDNSCTGLKQRGIYCQRDLCGPSLGHGALSDVFRPFRALTTADCFTGSCVRLHGSLTRITTESNGTKTSSFGFHFSRVKFPLYHLLVWIRIARRSVAMCLSTRFGGATPVL